MGLSSSADRKAVGTSESFAISLDREIDGGPVATFLKESGGIAEVAVLRAKAALAAFDARKARDRPRNPRWLLPVLSVIIGPLILGIVLHTWTMWQESKRKQADVLLSKLSSLVIQARELRNDVAYAERDDLSPVEAESLHGKAVELEEGLESAVQLHDFSGVADLRRAELRSWCEVRALQDCLQRSNKEQLDDTWRNRPELDKGLLDAASSNPPCAGGFDFSAFDDLTNAANAEIAARIGGALFPRRKSTPLNSDRRGG